MRSFAMSQSIEIQKRMMSIMGYWHKEKPTTLYKCKGVTTMSVFLIAYAGMIAQVVHEIDDFQKLSEVLYMMISYSSFFCKLLGYLYAKETFLSMLRHLENPIFTSYPSHLERHLSKVVKLAIIITKLYRGCCAVVIVLFSVYPLLDDKPLPTPVPYDLGRYTPIMYGIESAAILIAAWNNFCLDTLCFCLMSLAIGQLDILKGKIAEFTGSRVGEGPKVKVASVELPAFTDVQSRRLANCVSHHNALIKFVAQIESVFSFGLLAQLLGSIIVICNTGFFLLMVSPFSMQFLMLFSYFVTMMTQLSLYCWYGNEIMLKSLEVSESCYASQWYTCNISVMKSLFIIMERSKRPLCISAMKFSNLSLASFTSIIQWSYSSFALLQRVANK